MVKVVKNCRFGGWGQCGESDGSGVCGQCDESGGFGG